MRRISLDESNFARVDRDSKNLVGTIDRYMRYLLRPKPDSKDLLDSTSSYLPLQSGGRLRPQILIRTAECYGAPLEAALPPASAIELFHCSTLILDDLPCMDNSSLRRGVKSTHLEYGEDLAILAAFDMKALGDREIAKNNLIPSRSRNRISYEIANDSRKLFRGQVSDLHPTENEVTTISDILRVYEWKSGILFGCSAAIGGIIGGADEMDIKNLRKFGNRLGILYQIVDDLYDVVGNPSEGGKPINQDREKKTLISIIGEEETREWLNIYEGYIHDSLDKIKRPMASLREFVSYLIQKSEEKLRPS